jgi:hypothetical protein
MGPYPKNLFNFENSFNYFNNILSRNIYDGVLCFSQANIWYRQYLRNFPSKQFLIGINGYAFDDQYIEGKKETGVI